MITIPCVYVWWIDAWQHHYEFIYRKHIINNGIILEAFFFQILGWYNSLVKRISAEFYTEKKNDDTKKTLRSHHFIDREKLGKFLSCILSIDNDEADLGKKTNQFINDISEFNNKNIIQ